MSSQGSVAPYVKPQWFTNNGVPAAGYQLFTYLAGTDTKEDTYQNAGLSILNTNPIILDAAGRANIFVDALSYKFVLATPTDTDPPVSPIWTVDAIPGAGGANQPWFRIVGTGIVHPQDITDKIGIGTASPTKLFSVAEKFTVDSIGRMLSNTVATWDLAGNVLATSFALDPNGQAGDSDYGGTVTLADGKQVRLISLSGTMAATAPATVTAFAGIEFNLKNTGTGTNAATYGIIGQTRLTASGTARAGYFRGAADAGATGFTTCMLLAPEAASTQTVGNAIGLMIHGDGDPNVAYAIGIRNDSGSGFNHGIAFFDDFDASASAIRLRQASLHGRIIWSATPYIESSAANKLVIGATTLANIRVGIGVADPQQPLDVLGNIAFTGYAELTEMVAPSAPAANKGRLYCEDTGGGKTRLVVLFPSGVAQVIATEP